MSKSVAYSRTPYLIVHREQQARKEVYGSVDDALVLQAQILRGEADSQTALIAMHPMGAAAYLPVISQLARCGHHVVACGTRYWSGDAALQMENVLVDLGACIRDARERLGYRKIVLVGWSGGGSLMAGYQAEAERPVVKQTAAGEDTALAAASLLPADGLMLIASHRSRHHLLTGQLDASIIDERNPAQRNREFDLYDPANSNQPTYSSEFITGYRAAQLVRNRRITDWAKDKLAALRAAGRPHDEHCFTVYGTMADPRWLDASIDPNDRKPGWTYLGEPRIVNDSPVGLGRYSSLRSWLSQWSYDDAQFDSVDAGPRITVPSLVLTASADDACPPSHTDAIFAALGAGDKQQHVVKGANHYFSGKAAKQHLGEAMDTMGQWLNERGFGD